MDRCVCCGGRRFHQAAALWPQLIAEWGLEEHEAAYIERQQGFSCVRCGSSLRSMALAAAVLSVTKSRATFRRFVLTHPWLRVLEVNEAGQLTQFLRRLPRHRVVRHPDVDLMDLPFGDGEFDFVLHSDTLEHVPDPVRALAECHRVLRPGGFLCYTVPIVVGRLTKTRDGAPASYHGTASWPGYEVHTEYGADAWAQPMAAGFDECRIFCLEFPAALALVAPRRRRDQ